MEYHSDKELGPKPRIEEIISPEAWGGIVALINSLIANGAFGFKYPEICPEGNVIVGTNEHDFSLALKAEIPNINWPLKTSKKTEDGYSWEEEPYAPDTLTILDLIQFCYKAVASPRRLDFHPYYKHYHLTYENDDLGKEEFREKINIIFTRNGIAYELCANINIKRLVPTTMKELFCADFRTGDQKLDEMLAEAKNKFLNPKPEIRKEALERIWDCWERLKSLDASDPSGKKKSADAILDKATSIQEIRSLLGEEAQRLTNIGNDFHIRHSEKYKIDIQDSNIIDYLFYRMFSMIHLLIRSMKSQQ